MSLAPRQQDAKYFKLCLDFIPAAYSDYDMNRMSLAFFGLSGLDVLNALDVMITEQTKKDWIEWVYAMQIHPDKDAPHESVQLCGFRGSSSTGRKFEPNQTDTKALRLDCAHLAMTYTALANLVILGDDLSRVNRDAITMTLRYPSSSINDDPDMRFLYTACAVSYFMNDWRGVDKERAVAYILSSQTYDYGFALGPGLESHGGMTFCAIAALYLMDRLDAVAATRDKIILWLLNRQESGFAGRIGKPADTCYAFWVGASLKMLGGYDYVDKDACQDFLLSTQSQRGGFSKYAGDGPDLLHSYMGFAGLALAETVQGIRSLHPALNISEKATNHLNSIYGK